MIATFIAAPPRLEHGLGDAAPRLGVVHQRPRDDRPHARPRLVRVGLVDHERVDQALVAVCDVRRARAARRAGRASGRPGPRTARPPISGLTATAGHAPALERVADLRRPRGSGRCRRTGCSARSRSGRPPRAPRARRARRARPRRPRSGRRRPRRGARARRTTPGTGTRRRASRPRCAAGRRSPAAAPARAPSAPRDPRRHGRERLARAQRLGADEVQRRGRGRRAGTSVSPPSSATVSSAFQVSSARPQPRSSSSAAGERVEDAVEVGRDVEAEHLDVVADVADDRQLGRVDRLGQRAREAVRRRGRPRGRRPSRGEPARSASSAARCAAPSRPSSRSRSASVSTSSTRFGIAAIAASTPSRSARARNRSALPRPVERREQVRRRERERVRRAVGRLDEREPALGQRAEQREQVARPRARAGRR